MQENNNGGNDPAITPEQSVRKRSQKDQSYDQSNITDLNVIFQTRDLIEPAPEEIETSKKKKKKLWLLHQTDRRERSDFVFRRNSELQERKLLLQEKYKNDDDINFAILSASNDYMLQVQKKLAKEDFNQAVIVNKIMIPQQKQVMEVLKMNLTTEQLASLERSFAKPIAEEAAEKTDIDKSAVSFVHHVERELKDKPPVYSTSKKNRSPSNSVSNDDISFNSGGALRNYGERFKDPTVSTVNNSMATEGKILAPLKEPAPSKKRSVQRNTKHQTQIDESRDSNLLVLSTNCYQQVPNEYGSPNSKNNTKTAEKSPCSKAIYNLSRTSLTPLNGWQNIKESNLKARKQVPRGRELPSVKPEDSLRVVKQNELKSMGHHNSSLNMTRRPSTQGMIVKSGGVNQSVAITMTGKVLNSALGQSVQGPSKYGTLKSITSSVHRSKRGGDYGGIKSSEKARLGESIDIKVESTNRDQSVDTAQDAPMQDYEEKLVRRLNQALQMQVPRDEAGFQYFHKQQSMGFMSSGMPGISKPWKQQKQIAKERLVSTTLSHYMNGRQAKRIPKNINFVKQHKRNVEKQGPEGTSTRTGNTNTKKTVKRNSIEINPQVFIEPKVIRKDQPDSGRTAAIDNSKFNDVATFRDANSPMQADREVIQLKGQMPSSKNLIDLMVMQRGSNDKLNTEEIIMSEIDNQTKRRLKDSNNFVSQFGQSPFPRDETQSLSKSKQSNKNDSLHVQTKGNPIITFRNAVSTNNSQARRISRKTAEGNSPLNPLNVVNQILPNQLQSPYPLQSSYQQQSPYLGPDSGKCLSSNPSSSRKNIFSVDMSKEKNGRQSPNFDTSQKFWFQSTKNDPFRSSREKPFKASSALHDYSETTKKANATLQKGMEERSLRKPLRKSNSPRSGSGLCVIGNSSLSHHQNDAASTIANKEEALSRAQKTINESLDEGRPLKDKNKIDITHRNYRSFLSSRITTYKIASAMEDGEYKQGSIGRDSAESQNSIEVKNRGLPIRKLMSQRGNNSQLGRRVVIQGKRKAFNTRAHSRVQSNLLNIEANQLNKMLENVISDKHYSKLIHLAERTKDASPKPLSQKREDLFSNSQVFKFFARQLDTSEEKLSAEASKEEQKLVNYRVAPPPQQPSAIQIYQQFNLRSDPSQFSHERQVATQQAARIRGRFIHKIKMESSTRPQTNHTSAVQTTAQFTRSVNNKSSSAIHAKPSDQATEHLGSASNEKAGRSSPNIKSKVRDYQNLLISSEFIGPETTHVTYFSPPRQQEASKKSGSLHQLKQATKQRLAKVKINNSYKYSGLNESKKLAKGALKAAQTDASYENFKQILHRQKQLQKLSLPQLQPESTISNRVDFDMIESDLEAYVKANIMETTENDQPIQAAGGNVEEAPLSRTEINMNNTSGGLQLASEDDDVTNKENALQGVSSAAIPLMPQFNAACTESKYPTTKESGPTDRPYISRSRLNSIDKTEKGAIYVSDGSQQAAKPPELIGIQHRHLQTQLVRKRNDLESSPEPRASPKLANLPRPKISNPPVPFEVDTSIAAPHPHSRAVVNPAKNSNLQNSMASPLTVTSIPRLSARHSAASNFRESIDYNSSGNNTGVHPVRENESNFGQIVKGQQRVDEGSVRISIDDLVKNSKETRERSNESQKPKPGAMNYYNPSHQMLVNKSALSHNHSDRGDAKKVIKKGATKVPSKERGSKQGRFGFDRVGNSTEMMSSDKFTHGHRLKKENYDLTSLNYKYSVVNPEGSVEDSGNYVAQENSKKSTVRSKVPLTQNKPVDKPIISQSYNHKPFDGVESRTTGGDLGEWGGTQKGTNPLGAGELSEMLRSREKMNPMDSPPIKHLFGMRPEMKTLNQPATANDHFSHITAFSQGEQVTLGKRPEPSQIEDIRPSLGGVYNVVVPDIKILRGANSPPDLSKEFSSREPSPDELLRPLSQPSNMNVMKYHESLKNRLQNIQSMVQDQGSKANARLLEGVLEHIEDYMPQKPQPTSDIDNLAMKFNQFFQVGQPDSIYSSQGLRKKSSQFPQGAVLSKIPERHSHQQPESQQLNEQKPQSLPHSEQDSLLEKIARKQALQEHFDYHLQMLN